MAFAMIGGPWLARLLFALRLLQYIVHLLAPWRHGAYLEIRRRFGKFHGDAGMSNPLMASIHLIRAADPPTNKPNVQVGRRTRPLRYLGAYGLSRGVGRLNMLVTRCNGVKLC